MPRKGGKGKEGGKPEASEEKAPKGVTFDQNDPGKKNKVYMLISSNPITYSFDATTIGICSRQELWLL